MKHIYFVFVLSLGILAGSCSGPKGERIIERPDRGLQSSKTIEIDRIQLTDTSTVFHINAFYRPKNWIRIDPGTYLLAEGQKYMLQSADGIEIGAEHYMPENGEDSFVFHFPALPKGIKKVDFFESDCDNCFKIWDIDLTGKPISYKPELPGEILNASTDEKASLLEPQLKIGTTKVTLYITGLRDGFVIGEPELLLNNFLIFETNELAGKQEAEGKYVFEFEQYGTAKGTIVAAGKRTTIILAPGENAEVYFDVTALSRHNSRYNPQPEMVYAGFKGEFAQINNQLLRNEEKMNDCRIQLFNIARDSTIIDKTPDQYLQYIVGLYNEKITRINDSIQDEGVRRIAVAVLKSDMVQCVTDMGRVFEYSYRIKHNKRDFRQPIDYTPPKVDEKALLTLKEFDLGDPLLVCFGGRVGTTLMEAVPSYRELENIIGSKSLLLQDMYCSFPAMRKAPTAEPLTEEEQSKLNAASSPFYAEAYAAMSAKVKQQVDEAMNKGGFEIMPTPKVSNDKLLDAIVAASKGKPVFVDFWATWCGPCVSAMKTMKPLKTEMAENGVEMIYISYEGSPKPKWTGMLPDIGGIHYYLTNEQWRAIKDKYKIKGIPTYMIFDKTGKKVYEIAGFPGVDAMREELAKVW